MYACTLLEHNTHGSVIHTERCVGQNNTQLLTLNCY